MMHRRILALVILTWLPLLVLSFLEGHLWGGGVAVPFLKDVEAHARFLVVLPLLIVAEYAVHRRISPLPRRFVERKLMPEHELPRLEAAMASARRWCDSMFAEVMLVAFVYGVGILVIWRHYVTLKTGPGMRCPQPTARCHGGPGCGMGV